MSAELPPNDGDPRTPAVYVASLADYSAGRLHGAWVAADQEPDVLLAAADAMLASSPEPGAENWAIHDHDNLGGLQIGELSHSQPLPDWPSASKPMARRTPSSLTGSASTRLVTPASSAVTPAAGTTPRTG